MKILKVEFRNINSLKDTHSIDFTIAPFTTSSLFAITGPTGSGKSTILDVISLALFNHVPRLGKISKKDILEKGAILTRNQKEAFARVTYECKSGIYTSEWNISTARTGSLRDYDMQISREPSGELLPLKKSDVPGRNEELIGLNYNQFIKSVLLAQGEFSQFLRARKEERGELLEKITGTGIYRQLGRMSFEKFRDVNQLIQKQQDAIEVIKQGLLEETQFLDITASLSDKEKTCEPLEKEIHFLTKNLELKKTIEQQLKEIDRLAGEKESADLGLKKFLAGYGPILEKHEKVRDVAEDLRDWKRLTLSCADLDKDVGLRNDQIKENSGKIEECLREASGFTRMQVAQENIEMELENFAGKVSALQKKVDDKLVEYESLKNTFRLETRELNCPLNEKEPQATAKQLEDLKITASQKVNTLRANLTGVDLENIEGEKFRLKRYLVEAREAWKLSDNIERLNNDLLKFQKEENLLLTAIKGLPGEIRHNEDNVKIFQEKLKNIRLEQRNRELQASLEEHRTQLEDGKPCPLCGALHHPYAEDTPGPEDGLPQKLLFTEKELSTWMQRLNSNTTTLKHHENNLKQITAARENIDKELGTCSAEFRENYKNLGFEEKADWKNLCNQSQIQLEQLEEYEKVYRSLECVETALPLINRLIKISAEGRELRVNLEDVYKGKDIHRDSQQFHNRWTALRELDKGINSQLRELKEKVGESREKLNLQESSLKTLISEKGFRSIPEAGEALLPDNEYYRLHTSRGKLEKEIEKTRNTLDLLASQVEKHKKDDVEHSAEVLLNLQLEKKHDLKLVQDECEELRWAIKNHNEDLKRLQHIKDEIRDKEKENKRWHLLNLLIGDAQGKRFNDFAQDLTLSQLLVLANIRLKDLSDRYRIDKPTAAEDDGLVAIDEHMGGQRRSVKTLSGGETFILSLSMALALSDLASRNVEINSLFIDEGFGTLDPETLDQTLDTLEKLQAESSKTIGIISHVDSLKERIATQIKLKRHGQGYSTLEITG
ncbi:AAA family ATPase [soil metagenome]